MWKLEIQKLKCPDDNFSFEDHIEGKSLLEIVSKFNLTLVKINQLQTQQLNDDLRIARLVPKDNNLSEDDIPF
jgi:hypothetical protein